MSGALCGTKLRRLYAGTCDGSSTMIAFIDVHREVYGIELTFRLL